MGDGTGVVGADGRDMGTDFHIEDPSLNDSLEETLDALLAKCPVAHSTVGHGYTVFNRYEDVKRCAQDWETFSSAGGYMVNRPEGAVLILPEECDPPYHDTWRRALNPFLSPTTIASYEAPARQYANELIDAFAATGSCEFVGDFAAQLPGMVLFNCIIPVPVEDLPWLFETLDIGTFGPLEERGPSFVEVYNYIGDYLAARRDEGPRGDVVDLIVAGVDKDGEPAPWEDRISVLVDLVYGGLATTTHVMSAAIHHLALNPADRQALVEDPSLIPAAVEEFIRVFPPVIAVARHVTADVEVAGEDLSEGDWVLLNYASASRDPEVVEDPTTIDIRRESILHSTFGIGVHRCIGSHLARLELTVTIEEMLRRIPEFSVAPGSSPSYETGQLRTMKNVQLVFDPASA
ncbi:MAG: cytochrome P450 [Acidimicrobiales bacterium]